MFLVVENEMAEASIITYQEDDIIVKQGDPDKSFYKIVSGKVALYMNYGKDDEYLMGIQTFPSCFGEMTILAEQPSLYTVVAVTEAKVLRVPEKKFENFIYNNPENAITIMKTMAKNISLLNMNIKLLTEEISYISSQVGESNEAFQTLFDKCDKVIRRKAKGEESAITVRDNKKFNIYLKGHREHPEVLCRANKEHTYLKEFVCPHCGTKFVTECFNATSLRRKRIKKRDSSYEVRYEFDNFLIEWYQIVTCTHCYFSAFIDVFQQPDLVLYTEKYEEDLRIAFSSLLLNFSTTKNLDFVFTQYYLALICARGLIDRKQINARLWLGLSRLYEDAGDNDLAEEANKRAAEAFKEHYVGSILQAKSEHLICLNIGARLYAFGDVRASREIVLLLMGNREEETHYKKMAQELLIEIRKNGKNI